CAVSRRRDAQESESLCAAAGRVRRAAAEHRRGVQRGAAVSLFSVAPALPKTFESVLRRRPALSAVADLAHSSAYLANCLAFLVSSPCLPAIGTRWRWRPEERKANYRWRRA